MPQRTEPVSCESSDDAVEELGSESVVVAKALVEVKPPVGKKSKEASWWE